MPVEISRQDRNTRARPRRVALSNESINKTLVLLANMLDTAGLRDKDGVRERVLVPVVNRANEVRAERGIARLPKVTPHALRRRYISLMLKAGAPLPYVMDQVGHAGSKTTLEIYAQLQKRISRKNVHAAFDRLLTGWDSDVVRSRL